jgi:hypothetical protein
MIAAVSGPAPTVTAGAIAAAIVGEYYFTGQDGVAGVAAREAARAVSEALALTGVMPELPALSPVVVKAHPRLRDVTFCVLVLRNAFVVVGTSCPVAPENFDAAKGREAARADAVRQCWPLLGYALREELHATSMRTPIWPQFAAGAVVANEHARTIIGDVAGDAPTTNAVHRPNEPTEPPNPVPDPPGGP